MEPIGPPDPTQLGDQLVEDVLKLREAYPALPPLELFDQAMEGWRGARVDFAYRPEQDRWATFGGLAIDALLPYTAAERARMDDEDPQVASDFYEGDEHRPLHAIQRLELRYELNGLQGREAWAAAYAARVRELTPNAVAREVQALGRALWDAGSWQMSARACAEGDCKR